MSKNKCIFEGIGNHEENCDGGCYPSILAYGLDGDRGFYKSSRTPNKYRSVFLEDLPIEKENPDAYKVTRVYVNRAIEYVEKGVGLFFFSVPNKDNPRGTGTGKTQTAITIGNEYQRQRIVQHCTGGKRIETQPTLFIRMAEFQNTYNKQFRGGFEEQETASNKFNKMLKAMETSELLILDDISLRSSTEAMTNILYEVLDDRYINEKPVIFTSNYPITRISELLSPQIQSRIEGMTEQIAFNGKDYRKGGVL